MELIRLDKTSKLRCGNEEMAGGNPVLTNWGTAIAYKTVCAGVVKKHSLGKSIATMLQELSTNCLPYRLVLV